MRAQLRHSVLKQRLDARSLAGVDALITRWHLWLAVLFESMAGLRLWGTSLWQTGNRMQGGRYAAV